MLPVLNYKDGAKMLVVSRRGHIRPFIDEVDGTTIQEAVLNDYVVCKRPRDKQLSVWYFQADHRIARMVSKKVYMPIIEQTCKNPIVRSWFFNNEPKLPDNFIWCLQDFIERPLKTSEYYGLNIFLPELGKQHILEMVGQFKTIDIANQFVKIDIDSIRESIDTVPEVQFPASKKDIKKLFSFLPDKYSEFILENNIGEDGVAEHINTNSCKWTGAKQLPKSIAVGALYDNGELKRFTDVIIISKSGEVKLNSVYTIGKTIKPVDCNLMLLACDIPKDTDRIIYVVHHIDDEDKIRSNWRLFRKRN